MKSIKQMALGLMLVVAISSQANTGNRSKASQNAQGRNHNIYVNPLGLLLGTFNATYEIGLSDRIGLGFSGSFASLSVGTTSSTAFGAGVKPIFYLTADRLNDSWFVLPFLDFVYASSNSVSVAGFALGANVGYWWFFENGINLGVGLGIQYWGIDFGRLGIGSLSAFLPSAMFTVGFAF